MQALSAAFQSAVGSGFPPDFMTRDPQDLEAYGKDWTKVYAPKPSAIAMPRSTDEVARFLKLCSEYGVAVVPSGGRTGLAGGAVAANGEVVLSLVRMTKMGEVDELAHRARASGCSDRSGP